MLIEGLAPALRTGLDAARAVDVFIASTPPATFRSLTDRGWTADEYEKWLGDLLASDLLGS